MMTPLLGVAAVVGTFAVALPIPPKVGACPELTYCSTTYYVNRSYTTMTGGLNINCIGIPSSWGTRSSYVRYVEVPC
ncbi:MAG TPA: hypothetical protein VF755_30120 [Catenuloplanes sp.]